MRWRQVAASHAPAAVILIRLVVGAVFLSEGIQKFLFSAELGAGALRKDRSSDARVPRPVCRHV